MKTILVIGASNVTKSLPLIWEFCRQAVRPVRLIAVAGHGRSFGLPSTVFGRTLPSILQSGVWAALESLSVDEKLDVLLTDVGNDIVYGAQPHHIESWVRECLERLQPRLTSLAMTELPIGSLQSLSRARFAVFRRLLFPASPLKFETAMTYSSEVNATLRELAREFGATLHVPRADWYGLDPIHVRSSCKQLAWQEYLQPLFVAESTSPIDAAGTKTSASPSMIESLRVWRMKPDRRWLMGREQVTPQPVARASDGELWLY